LASCQRRLGVLIVSGLIDGVSAGTGCAAGIIPVSARMSGSSNLSDFADSFGTGAIPIWLRSGATLANEESDDVATLIAIEAPEVTRQKRAIHIVLVILDPKFDPKFNPKFNPKFDPKAPASRSRMGADVRDQIRAARWLTSADPEIGSQRKSIANQ
jgi:hypothetical protein